MTSNIQITPPSLSKGLLGGLGCLAVFALPFIVGGLVVIAVGCWPILRSLQASTWNEVPALILSASVEPASSNNGSESQRLVASYSYTVDGSTLTSDVPSFYTNADNLGSYHQDKLNELTPYIGSSSPFRAYVNPSDPSDAVLFREIRWEATIFFLIFGLVFAGAGFAMLFGGIYGVRSQRFRAVQEAQKPSEPWSYRKDWAAKEVHCSSSANFFLLLCISVIANGLSAAVPFMIIEEFSGPSPNYFVLLALLFNVIGLALLWATIVAFLRWRRFGRSRLLLTEVPFRLGGQLRATLVATSKLQTSNPQMTVHLKCNETTTTGSGKNRSTRTITLAEEKVAVQLSSGMNRGDLIHVPIRMPVPSSGEATRDIGNPTVSWELCCDASLPGVDYAASFPVPVF